jgi:hypothetical protein
VKKTPKRHLQEAKFYHFLSILFLGMGLVVFILIYMNRIEGRLLEAFSEPLTIFMIIFPFSPAIVLSWLAKSSEKRYFSGGLTKNGKT